MTKTNYNTGLDDDGLDCYFFSSIKRFLFSSLTHEFSSEVKVARNKYIIFCIQQTVVFVLYNI